MRSSYYLSMYSPLNKSPGSAVGIRTVYWLNDTRVRVRFAVGSRIFTSPIIHTCSGAHPASYPIGTEDSFPGDKAAGT
jgi:hypothetical protein